MESASKGHSSAVGYVVVAVLAVSSYAVARYLNTPWTLVTWLLLFVLCILAVRGTTCEMLVECRRLSASVLVFSLAFDVALILGSHIVIGDTGIYSGLSNENYISNYHVRDAFSFVLMLPALFILFVAPALRCRGAASVSTSFGALQEHSYENLGARQVLLHSAIIFVGWLPYIVIYWPGFIFGDSLVSLSQVYGYAPLSDHHPVAYTAYLGFWVKLAASCGLSATWGIGLSSIVQSLLLSLTFGYLCRWIVVRGGLKRLAGFAVAIVFAVSPYIATYGMALWKDPLFSAALVLFTLCLTDFIASKGSVLRKPSFLLLVVVSLLVMVFFRNNGLYVALATIAAVGALCLIWKRRDVKACFAPFVVALVGVVAVYLIVSSAIFPAIGVRPSEKVESVGIPLNQMARVAALDGEMSESDRAYLDELLPYDEYKTTYTPCCTDTLKWSSSFNGAALESGMWSHWLSMFAKNPKVYFESWELQTFGFWTVNTEQQVNWSWNISGGVPRNCDSAYVSELDNYGIQSNPAALDAEWHNVLLPYNDWSISIGWLTWAVVYLLILLVARGRKSLIVALVPSAALILTLVIASPFCYWPRYGAALQFLVPFLVLLFYDAITSRESSIRRFVGDDR